MKRLPILALAIVVCLVGLLGCHPRATAKSPRLVGSATLVDRFSLLTGTSGTVTVPAGCYVLGMTATVASGNGTVAITPCGPDIASCTASNVVTVPAANPFSLGPPTLKGGPDEMGDGTTIVFGSTSRYVVAIWQYSP